MPKLIAIAGLTMALLALGAYAPQAQVSAPHPANITVAEKNQFWLPKGLAAASCSRSPCQDV
jgi:hypothetical protein